MSSSFPQSERNHAASLLPEDTTTSWRSSIASAQYRQSTGELLSQSHIRPGADQAHEPEDSPDMLLIHFLRSNERYEVDQSSDTQKPRRTPQGVLREIFGDPRWTRRKVEDFYKEINPGVKGLGSCLTPFPFHRTLYLILLNALEDKEKVSVGTEDENACGGGSESAEVGLAELEGLERNRVI